MGLRPPTFFAQIGAVALLFVALTLPKGAVAQASGAHLPIAGQIAPPTAAATLCKDYAWACRAPAAGRARGDTLTLASNLNRHINRRVRPVEDSAQYGIADRWTLPSARGGDCEDVALLKKRDLIAAGVAPHRLLIATVMSRRTGAHAVLVLRLDQGDFVLDSVTDKILPWHESGYTFMRMQNPRAPSSWVLVAARG